MQNDVSAATAWAVALRALACAAGLALILWLILPRSAAAQAVGKCMTAETMARLLSTRYAELPTVVGTVGKNRLMHLYASQKGSWTIVITDTDGRACILAAGQNLEGHTSESGKRT